MPLCTLLEVTVVPLCIISVLCLQICVSSEITGGLDDLLTWVPLTQALQRALFLLYVPFQASTRSHSLSPIKPVVAFLITVPCIAS